ncbi:MAG: hypothetical protein OXT65_00355 [Alphaproteobacteria bacterium]|nr:hypothetical protein [Alphaproteobacteria bacterium]
MIQVSTPAKIILSGEHSAVYGAPVIGVPLALSMQTQWQESGRGITLDAQGCSYVLSDTWGALLERLADYRARYVVFQRGETAVTNVLPRPEDLVMLTLAAFCERYGTDFPALSLSVRTDIPVAAGLGSSSALIINLLEGMQQWSGHVIPQDELIDFAREIENFQHGVSSGVDLAIVSTRKPIVFVRGQGVVGNVPPPRGLTLVHTGTPSVSTGVCVSAVREKYGADQTLWNNFSLCTERMRSAFANDNALTLKECIIENQRLLEHIGIVPEKVRSFVAACRDKGIAAKICGAGAVKGNAAGIVWALPENDSAGKDLQGIAAQYGYEHGCYATYG